MPPVTAVGLSQIHRPALVFQIPGILQNYDQLDKARAALGPELDKGFSEAGFKMLGWADVGQTRIFSRSPVKTPADLANKRPWLWRDDLVLPSFYGSTKTTPVPLQVPEVLGALQTNRIDTLIVSPVSAVSLQWSSRVTHMTAFPINITVGGTVLSDKTFKSLSAEHQKILLETADQFHALARRNLRNDEKQALATLAQRNISVVNLSKAEEDQWRALSAKARAKLAGKIADAKLVDQVAKFGQE
ncbi:MAG: TRAP transporter substrate-binding protein DctP [Polyangiales bacterium]